MWSVPRCSNRDGLGEIVSCNSIQFKVRLRREDWEVGVRWPPAWEQVSWKGAAVQRGHESRSRGITTVRSRYPATTSEDTTGWKILDMIL
jgi:hypothetical protein